MHAIVLPRFDDSLDGPRVTPLDRDAAAEELVEHVERQGTKYDPFMADWFPHTDQARRDKLIDRLLDETPFYRLEQHMGRLSAGTDLLLDTIAGVGRG